MTQPETLDAFVDELIKRAAERRYYPTQFMSMRQRYGTAQAIQRLVETSSPQTGFHRLQRLNLLPWSIEAAVVKFPAE